MIKTLKLDDRKDLGELSKTVGHALQSVSEGDEKKTLVQTNGIFIENGLKLQAAYLNVLREFHKTETQKLDFSSNPEASRAVINKWISDNTKEKIKELLGEGSITDITRLVLANAVYFKGRWLMTFNKHETNENAIFHTLSNGDIKTSMMYQKRHFKRAYFAQLGVTVARIPFECHEMWIALPTEEKGLPEVLKRLQEHPELFKEMFTSDQYFSSECILRLPKFTLEGESIPLKGVLSSMGLGSIFSHGTADLSGITGDKSLWVDDVYHQAVIEVDEEGAEAAAATATVFERCSMPMPPEEFIVDHPFIFFIVTQTGFPVFMGHVVEPKHKV